jgi:exosortase D (VPLPA-CTERM-specific)
MDTIVPPFTTVQAGARNQVSHPVPNRWSRLLTLAGVGILAALLLVFAYADSLAFLFQQWMEDDNYSHGIFVPVIVGYLIWWRRSAVIAAGVAPSWWGVGLVLVGLILFVLGELSTLYVVLYLSLWFVVVGLVVAAIGIHASRAIIFPLGYLLTMFPLPQILEQNLSAQLQLISSAFGVGCLQLLGITAFREGNVIDLGPIQLQVVEACSGLRYLFPLTSLALLCAYLFQDRVWKKILLVASAVPIAIVLNGLRIGMIGLLVEWFGQGAAEGFMHAFEGWAMFVLSFSLLLCEMWLLARIASPRLSASPQMESKKPIVESAIASPALSPASITCLAILIGMVMMSYHLGGREETPPTRQSFLEFPMEISGWHGTPMAMEKHYVDTLRFDDYLLADFHGPASAPVNFYIAYYRSQKKGQSTHSPKTCLPGGGWEMTSLTQTSVTNAGTGKEFPVNRVVIQKGNDRQVVLYWFKQRDRLVTNEYVVKALLFWDALVRRRSDGALIRLTAPLLPGEDEKAADLRVQQFASLVQPMMSAYVPD